MAATKLLENYLPVVKYGGLMTNKDVDFSNAASLSLPSNAGLISTTAPVITGGLTASGSASNDFSGSTGTFKTSTGAVTLGGNTTVPTGKTLAVTDSAGLTIGGVIVANYEYVTSPTFAAATFVNGSAYPIYTFPNDGTTWKLVFASLRATTAGGASSTCTIYLDPSGTAPGAGTAQFAAMALDGTANTVVNAATPVNTASAAGAAISLKAGGAATTGLVGLVVTIAMQRLT